MEEEPDNINDLLPFHVVRFHGRWPHPGIQDIRQII